MSIPKPEYPAIELYIGGRWTTGSGSTVVAVIDPSSGDALGEVPLGSRADIEAAVDAAERAAASWRRTPPLERADILRAAATSLRESATHVAGLIALELGKPAREAAAEVITAAEHIEWAAEQGRRSYGRGIPGREPGETWEARVEPVGIVAGFAPWNAPVITPARKISSALAAGCTMVFKPSEETPASALFLVRALEEAGLPAGVLNVVFGEPSVVSETWLTDPRIKAVTFTGSTSVGRLLAQLSAPSMKRLTLELGGHSPVVVTANVDVEAVARSGARAAFRNSGQICTSPSRFYVAREIHDDFASFLADELANFQVGDPFDEDVDMGPVANESRIASMRELTQDAKSHGVDVRVGGHRIDRPGFFWAPTLLVDVDDDRMASNTEPFGPMALTSPIDTLDEAIARANRLPVALASYGWTDDVRDAARLSDEVDAGVVAINGWRASLPETPFGGFDDSGIGLEGGVEGLRAFQRIKCTAQHARPRI